MAEAKRRSEVKRFRPHNLKPIRPLQNQQVLFEDNHQSIILSCVKSQHAEFDQNSLVYVDVSETGTRTVYQGNGIIGEIRDTAPLSSLLQTLPEKLSGFCTGTIQPDNSSENRFGIVLGPFE